MSKILLISLLVLGLFSAVAAGNFTAKQVQAKSKSFDDLMVFHRQCKKSVSDYNRWLLYSKCFTGKPLPHGRFCTNNQLAQANEQVQFMNDEHCKLLYPSREWASEYLDWHKTE